MSAPGGRGTAPDPVSAASWPDLVARVVALYEWAGRPSFRELELRSKKAGFRISRGTAQNLAAGATNPQRRSLEAFVVACGVVPDSWLAAWDRLDSTARMSAIDEDLQVTRGTSAPSAHRARYWATIQKIAERGPQQLELDRSLMTIV